MEPLVYGAILVGLAIGAAVSVVLSSAARAVGLIA